MLFSLMVRMNDFNELSMQKTFNWIKHILALLNYRYLIEKKRLVSHSKSFNS